MPPRKTVNRQLSLDAACERTAAILQCNRIKIAELIRQALGKILVYDSGNLLCNISRNKDNGVILTAKDNATNKDKEITLLLKIISVRGGAIGRLAKQRALKITKHEGKNKETLLQELI